MKTQAPVKNKAEAIQEIEAIKERANQNNGMVSLSDRIRYEWLYQVVATFGLEDCKAKARIFKSEQSLEEVDDD